MFNESELLTHFHKICCNTEVLALKSLHDIELPLCGYLTKLTSSECLKLINSELDDWVTINQPSTEKILLNYMITDYICCGLSSPNFFTVFHTTLQSKNSKIKLLKVLTTFWYCLLKDYEITSVNVDFVKKFVVCLERLFFKISNFNDCIKCQCTKVISKLKHNIKMYDQSILDCRILHTSSDNKIEEHSSTKRKCFDLESTIQSDLKENASIPRLCVQTNFNKQNLNNSTTSCHKPKENLDLFKNHQTYNSETIEVQSRSINDTNLPKNSTPLSFSNGDLPNKTTEPDSMMKQPGLKLNAFQIMMFNAKKLKTKAK